jgi:hypothetical protein
MVIETFEDVITELNRIIKEARNGNNRIGYFAALYKNITLLVKQAAEEGYFEDRQQLEKLDVIFAQRYFDALHNYRHQRLPVSSPWYLVFKTNETKKLSIVQHLIMSINVHINYDLPIVCAILGPEEKIIKLCNDYFNLNMILSSSIKGVEKGIFMLSPLISLLARAIPKIERKLLNFSLNVARCKSWECACKQAIADELGKEEIIRSSGGGTNELSRRIIDPGLGANLITFFIRILEVRAVKHNIEVLDKNLLGVLQIQRPVPRAVSLPSAE